MRVVLDTNVLLSGLAYPASAPGRILAAWRAGSIEVVLSPWILAELARVLPRLNHRLGLTPGEQVDLVDSLAILADICDPTVPADFPVRDKADGPVLALLRSPDLQVQWLVTGDKDLLVLADQFAVMTPAEFCLRFAV